MTFVNRRDFIFAAASSATLWPLSRFSTVEAAERRTKFSDYPFQLGVASGDPAPDGMVIWTRLTTSPLIGGAIPDDDVRVRWRVATDEAMTKVVRSGVANATADWGHSVHVELHGLEPGRVYWYQFEASGETSPVGRTQTMPAEQTMPQQLRFAFASCQHYESGYYNAWRKVAQDDLNFVIHLGDYIYEGGIGKGKPRKHNSAEIVSLQDYRDRYSLYRSDKDLQAAHAAFPWIVTWDDHEFDNNYAGDVSEELDCDPVAFIQRRASAYQAYYEFMPLRRSSLPHGPFMQLYRNVNFGRLASFSVLDTRQFRTDQPCGDRNQEPCEGVYDTEATLLGRTQEKWLLDGLVASSTKWNVLAQQVMMARVDRAPGAAVAWSMDQWAGYDVGRKRLLEFMSNQGVSNPIVLTGDIHSNWVNDLKLDFDDPAGPTLATEFVGTSISSGGDGSADHPYAESVTRENPFVKFFNAERGYVRCQVTPQQWQSDYRVTPIVTKPDDQCLTRASFVVENGKAGALQA